MFQKRCGAVCARRAAAAAGPGHAVDSAGAAHPGHRRAARQPPAPQDTSLQPSPRPHPVGRPGARICISMFDEFKSLQRVWPLTHACRQLPADPVVVSCESHFKKPTQAKASRNWPAASCYAQLFSGWWPFTRVACRGPSSSVRASVWLRNVRGVIEIFC